MAHDLLASDCFRTALGKASYDIPSTSSSCKVIQGRELPRQNVRRRVRSRLRNRERNILRDSSHC